MTHSKPGLVTFSAVYLFISAAFLFMAAAIMLILVFSSINIVINPSNRGTSSPISLSGIAIVGGLFMALIGSFFIASGIGLLKRKKWARVAAIIIFSWSILGSLIPSQERASSGWSFNSHPLTLALSSLGLYAMTLDRKVKHYFNPSESDDESISYYRTEADTQGNLRLQLSLDFYEALWGCKKTIQFNHLEVKFNGQLIPVTKTLPISVPAGVEPGTCLTITGEGDANEHGGQPGDLHVFLIVPLEEGNLRRNGINIVSEMRITAEQARTGEEVSVEVVGGKTTLVIPPETKDGDVLTLRGYGVPKLNSHEKGDHIIHISVA